MIRRALSISAIVGTCLTLINQSDLLFAASFSPKLLWKIGLTYTVPFCVSLYSSVSTARGAVDRK